MGRRKDVRDEGWGGAVGATDRQLYYVVLEMLCRPKANARRSECAALRMTTEGPCAGIAGRPLSIAHWGARVLITSVRWLKFWSAHCMTVETLCYHFIFRVEPTGERRTATRRGRARPIADTHNATRPDRSDPWPDRTTTTDTTKYFTLYRYMGLEHSFMHRNHGTYFE